MSKAGKFFGYWWKTIATWKDNLDMIVWLVPSVLLVVTYVLRKIGLVIPDLDLVQVENVLKWTTGIALGAWALLWRPFEKYDALEQRIESLEKKKAINDRLGTFLADLEHKRGVIQAMPVADFADSSMEGEAAGLIAQAGNYVRDNVSKAESDIFFSLSECEWKKPAEPILIPHLKDAARTQQWIIDVLGNSVKELRKIIERRLA